MSSTASTPRYKMRDEGKLLVTQGHEDVWDLDDPNDENRFTTEA